MKKEPLIVVLALLVLWVIATGFWDRLAPAWAQLWAKPQVTKPSTGDDLFKWFQQKLIPKAAAPASVEWTPGIETAKFGTWV